MDDLVFELAAENSDDAVCEKAYSVGDAVRAIRAFTKEFPSAEFGMSMRTGEADMGWWWHPKVGEDHPHYAYEVAVRVTPAGPVFVRANYDEPWTELESADSPAIREKLLGLLDAHAKKRRAQ